jgi:hypothetical protein
MDKKAYIKSFAKAGLKDELLKLADYPEGVDDDALDEAVDDAADSIAESILSQQPQQQFQNAFTPIVTLFPQERNVPQFTSIFPIGYNEEQQDEPQQ